MTQESPVFEWLYPEILQKEDLIKVLKKRFIKKPDVESLDKDELLELYHKYIIPLPQRKYRQNRRGQRMTKQQIQLAKKRKHSSAEDSTEPPNKKQSSSGGLVTSFEHLKGAGDRLKPPPSCINLDKKTIKFGSNSGSPNISSSLNKLSIVKNKSTAESNSDSPEKRIKLNKSKGVLESDLKSNTIKLINKQMERDCESDKNGKTKNQSKEMSEVQSAKEVQKEDCNAEKMDTSESVPQEKEKKKTKITRISWP